MSNNWRDQKPPPSQEEQRAEAIINLLNALKKKEEDEKPTVLGCLTIIVLFVPAIIWGAWVWTVLWKWFIVPLGVVPVGIAHMVALKMMYALLTVDTSENKNKYSNKKMKETIFMWFVKPLFMLSIGWVLHYFMGFNPNNLPMM